MAVRYHLLQPAEPEKPIDASILWDDNDLAKVTKWGARGEFDYLLLQDAEGPMNEATDALGLPRIDRELVLYTWRDGGWKRVKSWSIPPALVQRS